MVKHYINDAGTPVTSYKTKYGEGNSVRCSIEQNSDLSWTTLWHDDRVSHRFSERDDETLIEFGCALARDELALRSVHFDLTHESINISIWGGNLRVIAYPEHPDYESFYMDEEEVEPSVPAEPIMGKVLFELCFSSKALR